MHRRHPVRTTNSPSTPASTAPGGATTTVAPAASGTHNSRHDASNACGACINTRPPDPNPPTRIPSQTRQRPLRNRHTLRHPRRTRREHHIRQIRHPTPRTGTPATAPCDPAPWAHAHRGTSSPTSRDHQQPYPTASPAPAPRDTPHPPADTPHPPCNTPAAPRPPTPPNAPSPHPTTHQAPPHAPPEPQPPDPPTHPTPQTTTAHAPNTTATASGDRPTCTANNSTNDPPHHPTPVSFHSDNTQRRSTPPRTSTSPTRTAGSAATCSNTRTSDASDRSVDSSNRSVAYWTTPNIPAGAPSASRCSARVTDRSNLGGVRRGQSSLLRPSARAAPTWSCSQVLERQQDLEQRVPGQRAARARVHQPLERHILVGVGGQVGLPDPRQQFGERRVAATSVRSTRVLTKKPTRSSSAASLRPATAVPMGMSVPAPSRESRVASAACTTMNIVAPCRWAIATSRACTCGAQLQSRPRRRGKSPTAGRGRSTGSVSSSGTSGQRATPVAELCADQALRVVQLSRAPRVATGRSRRTAPAAGPSRAPVVATRSVGDAQVAEDDPSTSRRRRCGAPPGRAHVLCARARTGVARQGRSGSCRSPGRPRR